ncbi:hypothetical protein SAMN05444350_13365 [Bacteroides stercorirosoris]|uniref:Uncharacterized protein n=1 Tax=Bacteroides stercorirosoris TaxID=871324 RepID=A0A1M6K1A1_9BACE|nr:hypothetical protein SAMN05444350_13365 [Bacteroides stercorirosoris]
MAESGETKKSPLFFCCFKRNLHLCSAQHLKQATSSSPTDCRWHFLCPLVIYIVPTPVWMCLMASQPVSGVEQRESGTFFFK